MTEPWDLAEALRRHLREARAEAKRAETPGFPDAIAAADTDDPAKPWRVVDDSGATRDYGHRQDARQAMYDGRGSSALYSRDRRRFRWQQDETLLRG